MPFLMFYSASDFEGGLPRESGAMAAGSGKFKLTLKADAQPKRVEINDDDGVLDEVDYGQRLAEDVSVGGKDLSAGTTMHSAYDLINTQTGHQITSIHFGGTGYQQGAVDGLVSTEPLKPGQTYTFNAERTSHRQDNRYDEFVACFTAGSLIETEMGPRAIEQLCPGDLVWTLDHGLQPVRWIGAQSVPAQGRFAPIRIAPGRFGNRAALSVSPEHRLLVRGAQAQILFGSTDVLVPAKAFLGRPGFERCVGGQVHYVHILCDRHEIVRVNGALCETLLLSDAVAGGLCGVAEAARHVPDGHIMQAARWCLRPWEAVLLAA